MGQLNKAIQQEGATALMRGCSATFYGSIAYGGSYFYAYPWLKVKGS